MNFLSPKQISGELGRFWEDPCVFFLSGSEDDIMRLSKGKMAITV